MDPNSSRHLAQLHSMLQPKAQHSRFAAMKEVDLETRTTKAFAASKSKHLQVNVCVWQNKGTPKPTWVVVLSLQTTSRRLKLKIFEVTFPVNPVSFGGLPARVVGRPCGDVGDLRHRKGRPHRKGRDLAIDQLERRFNLSKVSLGTGVNTLRQ